MFKLFIDIQGIIIVQFELNIEIDLNVENLFSVQPTLAGISL